MNTNILSILRNGALGVVVGVDMVLRTSALAILFFAGPLQAGVSDAAGIFLAATLVLTFVGIWRIGLPTCLSIVQTEPMAVLLPAAGIVGAASLSSGQAVATGFAVVGLTSIMIGVAFWLITALRLERYARLMPHAVVVGFLAATGVLLIMAALKGLAPNLLSTWTFGTGAENSEVVNLVLGIGIALALRIGSRLLPRYGVLLVIGVALVAFYGWMAASDMTLQEAQSRGLLSSSIGGVPNFLFMVDGWSQVDWSIIVRTIPHMAAATLVCVLALLLTIGGLEAIIRKDVPITQLFRTMGSVNFLVGFAGAGAGYTSLASVSILSMQKGKNIVAAFVVCAILVVAVVKVEWIISYAPKFLTSGLLIFVGIGILWDWLLTQFRKISLADWLIAFGIVCITVLLGILEAVAVGLLLAIMIFVINYARLPIVRSITTLATRRSTVDRDPEQLQFLADHADRVVVVSVQGFLFFGSVDSLVGTIRALLQKQPKTTRMILDFNHVIGIDSAGLEAFRKLEFALDENGGIEVCIANAKPDIVRAFEFSGLGSDGSRISIVQLSTDFALEQAEDHLLADLGFSTDTADARSALATYIKSDSDVETLLNRMERVHCSKGETLIRTGAASQEVYLIDQGRLSVFAATQSGNTIRVRALRPGTFVGEISGYLDQHRTADVVAEVDSVVYRIGPDFVQSLEEDAPRLAVQWHRMMAATLAERVDRTNRLLGELDL